MGQLCVVMTHQMPVERAVDTRGNGETPPPNEFTNMRVPAPGSAVEFSEAQGMSMEYAGQQ